MKIRFYFILIYLLILSLAAFAQHEDGALLRNVKGRVIDDATQEGIPFATLYIPQLEKGVECDVKGYFIMSIAFDDAIKITVNSLGYAAKDTVLVFDSKKVEIRLIPQSITLKEFSVTAKYAENSGSDAKIGEETLEYIQPTSIRDIFLLLPGGRAAPNNLQARTLIASRQAGSDQSTSFGMGVSADGVPMTNDGQRIQMSGYTGGGINSKTNLSVNSGVDLRTISTDHIESITVSRGIASAKEGNLSSGLIKITSKKGKTPFRVRIKSDPLNKLIYIGKGFLLSEKMGTLHFGADIIKSAADVRDIRSAYNRITSQANYNNSFSIKGKKITFNIKGAYVRSFNNKKTDELIVFNKEFYKTRYERINVAAKVMASLNYPLLDELEILTAANCSKDILYHEKRVQLSTIMGIQNSNKEGESEGEYLPSTYFTNYTIENKPNNYFGSISGTKRGKINDKFYYTVLCGNTINYTKNVGRGCVVDRKRPPFPSNRFIRPRPNYEIPAIVNNASFVETKIRYKHKRNSINLSLGLRGTKMFNLPKDYLLHRRVMVEPRMQLSYTISSPIQGHFLSNTIRLGYGLENKLPSIDYLYPDKEYQDFVVLNAYFADNPEKRLLITHTKIHNRVNSKIRENKNKKIEVGWDVKYNNASFSISLFKEVMSGGVEYFSEYAPISYIYYGKLKHSVEGKPSKDDFESSPKKTFTQHSKPNNSAKNVKKGIEYRINIPQIKAIKSDMEINGAYYHTLYTSGVPVMHRPSITENNEPFPYVGLYDGFQKTYQERFNTNVWINTRLPRLKLIVTNFLQIVWFESRQLGRDVDVYPYQYLNLNGEILDFTREKMVQVPQLKGLRREFSSPRYNKEKKPVSLLMNMKLTKEFNRSVKLSFFANNIIQFNPEYKTSFLRTRKNWHAPFFGTELILGF